MGKSVSRAPKRAPRPRRVEGAGAHPGSTRTEQAISAVTQLLVEATACDVERVLRVVDGTRDDTLDPELWGTAPTGQDAATAVVANLRKQFDARRELEASSVSRTEAAEPLGASEQAVTDALIARRLLGFKRGRRWVIPAWQLDAESEKGMLPGLGELADSFPGGLVALSAWATRPSQDLRGRQPCRALAHGEVDQVVQLSRTLTAAGW